MEAKEQAAGYVPIVFTQGSGKAFRLDRWRVTLTLVRGKIRVELLDTGPQFDRSDVDGDPESDRL